MGFIVGFAVGLDVVGDTVGDTVGRDTVGSDVVGDTVGDTVGDWVHPMQVNRQPAKKLGLLSQLPALWPLTQKSVGRMSTWLHDGEPVGMAVGDTVGVDVVGDTVGGNVGDVVGFEVVGDTVGDTVGDWVHPMHSLYC